MLTNGKPSSQKSFACETCSLRKSLKPIQKRSWRGCGAGTQVVFLISATVVLMLILASMFALRVPPRNEVPSDFLNTAVSR